jgi:hypothetical protein
LDNVVNLFYRFPTISFHDLIKPTPVTAADQVAELEWAASRPKSQCHKMPIADILALPNPWVAALTPNESANYDEYLMKHGEAGIEATAEGVLRQGRCFALGQSVKNGVGVASTPHVMYTPDPQPAAPHGSVSRQVAYPA